VLSRALGLDVCGGFPMGGLHRPLAKQLARMLEGGKSAVHQGASVERASISRASGSSLRAGIATPIALGERAA
jgi:hypothetical protein